MIYGKYKSAKFGLVSYCHQISLKLLNSDLLDNSIELSNPDKPVP